MENARRYQVAAILAISQPTHLVAILRMLTSYFPPFIIDAPSLIPIRSHL